MYRSIEGIQNFLDDIIILLNNRENPADEESVKTVLKRIYNYYDQLITGDNQFYEWLIEILDRDVELYSLVVSTIYGVCKDPNAILAMERALITEEVDPYWADIVLKQIKYIKFTQYSISDNYGQNRELNKKLLSVYEEQYPCRFPYIPYEERNHNRIVIETNQLLGTAHAPTKIVLDVCRSLMVDCGYEVFLIVNRDNNHPNDVQRAWFSPIISNVNSQIEGVFNIKYEDVSVRGIQYEWNKDRLTEEETVLRFISELKPLCVFHIGSDSYRHDIYRKMTTQLSMPCTAGYSVSEAQVLVCYANSKSQYISDSLEYIRHTGQLIKDIGFLVGVRGASGKNFTKKELGISDDKFAACIVGNRLEQELSGEFINMLEQVAKENDDIQYVIIGDCSARVFPSFLQPRITYLGFQSDFLDVLKVMDLFINPIRKGGGGGGYGALQMGTPVVTLKDCDVYVVAGDLFACDTLEDMKATIIRYLSDKNFYSAQVEHTNNWRDERAKNNHSKILGDLMEDIKDALNKGIIQ